MARGIRLSLHVFHYAGDPHGKTSQNLTTSKVSVPKLPLEDLWFPRITFMWGKVVWDWQVPRLLTDKPVFRTPSIKSSWKLSFTYVIILAIILAISARHAWHEWKYRRLEAREPVECRPHIICANLACPLNVMKCVGTTRALMRDCITHRSWLRSCLSPLPLEITGEICGSRICKTCMAPLASKFIAANCIADDWILKYRSNMERDARSICNSVLYVGCPIDAGHIRYLMPPVDDPRRAPKLRRGGTKDPAPMKE